MMLLAALFGVWAVWGTVSRARACKSLIRDVEANAKAMAEHRQALDKAIATVSAQEKNFQEWRQVIVESRELERAILQDALNRESRAKAALRAMLVHNGCTEEDIDTVMREINASENAEGAT